MKRKLFIFKNKRTGCLENFYGTSLAADVHVAYNRDLICVEVKDL